MEIKNQTCTTPTQLIVAALNEEHGIGITISEFQQVLRYSNILVVDGHSHDKTVEIAKDLGAEIAFQNGIGKGNAIAKGIEKMDLNAKYIILTDADYTYPAEFIPEMIKILERNPQVGMVCGNRFSGMVEEEAVRSSFYFGNKILSLAHHLLNGVDLQDPLTGLRVIRANLLKKWNVKAQGFDIEVELNHFIKKSGYCIVEVPISYRQRVGKKKLKAADGVTILKRILQAAI